MLHNITSWEFLNEPLYRWFIFFGALIAMSVAWHGVLDMMR